VARRGHRRRGHRAAARRHRAALSLSVTPETLKNLGETQILINYAHFQKDRMRGDTRLGWGRMTLIHDMAQVLPPPGPEEADALLTAWRENVDTLEDSSESMIKITDEIQRLRLTTIDILNHLR